MLSDNFLRSIDAGFFWIIWNYHNKIDFLKQTKDKNLRYRILFEPPVNSWPELNQGIEDFWHFVISVLEFKYHNV